ncbi:MAG: NAD-dependent epimerase/dehydratase family protein [Acidimicrobiales bacterium]|nr:NAD-dependent epimerase/dehydratase family protein [Acidimicrobiales bacterium]
MSGVVLTGSSGALGSRVATRLLASSSSAPVTGLDLVPGPCEPSERFHARRFDLATDDLAPQLAQADTLIHLASVLAPGPGRDDSGVDSGVDVELTERVLAAAGAAGVHQVVLVSSATVYGAWPDNPIPLTEDSPARPNPGFAFAEDKARVERLAERHRNEHPRARVAVLRPTTTLAEESASWVASALLSAAGLRAGEFDPPVQFLHFDDLASAAVLVAEQGCDGAFNVAPDGWIPPDAMRALAGIPRPRVPVAIAGRFVATRWRLGLSSTPPQILPWIMHPWVVANDRLRSLGWVPTHTNEEAYVAGTSPGPLDTLSPKRRQELAIGAAAAGVVASCAAGVGILRRVRRGR